MAFQHTPYTIPLLLGAAVHLLLLLYLLAYRSIYERVPGSRAASLLLIASMVWMLTYAFELSSVGLAEKLLWNKAQYFGSTALPALFLVYVLQYAGYERYVKRSTIGALSVVPILTVLLVVTNEAHGLIWQRVQMDATSTYTVLINEHGSGFWVFVAYSYTVILVGLALLGLRFVHSRGFYRWQTGGLFTGAVAPLFASVLYVSGLNPLPHLNIPVLAFVATSLTVGWSVFRHHLFSVRPIARDALIEEMDAAVLVVDDRDRVIDINDAARELVGRTGTITGTSIQAVWPAHADLLATDRSREFSEKVVTESPTGHRYYDLRVTPLTNRDGQQVGRLLVVRDVTDRERHERELEQFRAVTEAASDVIIAIDESSTVVAANPAVEDIFGYDLDEVVGESITMLMTEELVDGHLDAVREFLHTGKRTMEWDYVELTGRHRDGYEVPLAVSFNEYDHGGERFFAGVIRDNTERKRRERELQRQNEQLEEFAGVLSHDLRNPLSVARGYLEIAEEGGDEAAFRHVERAHDRIERIIADMLTLARQGQTVSDTAQVELAAVADAAWANVSTPSAELTIVDSRTLEADETRLLQLLENLFSNSVEHADGSVEVRVGATTDGFYVADDGPGIPENDREDVFAYGYSSREDGTGLGLSIVKNVAEAHGWKVDVDESWAGGARFEIGFW